MENTSEFLLRNVALSEDIMVLEELKQSKTVFLNHVLNLSHECFMCSFSIEIGVSFNIGGLGTCCRSVDDVFKAVRVSKELSILNLIVLVSIDCSNRFSVIFKERETKSSKNLTEHLCRYFKVLMAVKILEEALCVKSVLPNEFSEIFSDTLHSCYLSLIGRRSAIDDVSAT